MTLLQGLDPALECGCVWDSVLFQPLYWLLSLVWECSGAGGRRCLCSGPCLQIETLGWRFPAPSGFGKPDRSQFLGRICVAWREKSLENLELSLVLPVVQLGEENPRIPRTQGALEALSPL